MIRVLEVTVVKTLAVIREGMSYRTLLIWGMLPLTAARDMGGEIRMSGDGGAFMARRSQGR